MNFVPIAPQWAKESRKQNEGQNVHFNKNFFLLTITYIEKNVCALCMCAYFLALLMEKP